MQFESERELQETISEWLEYQGYLVNQEVVAGGGRVDILTENYLIKVKLVLTEAALFQAAGQIGIYRATFPYLSPVIAGLTPVNNPASSYSTATMLKDTRLNWK